VDPTESLRHLWERIQQEYRNARAGTHAIGANNPFNNQYFQQLMQGQLTAKGLTPGGATGGNYSNDMSGVFQGLLDRMKAQAQPAVNTVSNTWNKLFR
jgi:hypothetical protein